MANKHQYLQEMAASGYNTDTIDDFHRLCLPYLADRFFPSKDSKIMDIGVGLGHCLLPLKAAGYRNLTAIDCDSFSRERLLCCFGFVFLEAMAFKKPCIGARYGGIPEVVVDEKTGALVEYGNVKSIGSAIISMLKDNTTRKRLGEEGYKRLMDKFTFDIYKNKLLRLITNVRK